MLFGSLKVGYRGDLDISEVGKKETAQNSEWPQPITLNQSTAQQLGGSISRSNAYHTTTFVVV